MRAGVLETTAHMSHVGQIVCPVQEGVKMWHSEKICASEKRFIAGSWLVVGVGLGMVLLSVIRRMRA